MKLTKLSFDKCKSCEQIIETLTAALQFARMEDIQYIEVTMKTRAGAQWFATGEAKK